MKDLGTQIVVIDNGFVHVGHCSISDDFLKISNCRNLRVWGTTEGLAQLKNGPLKETKHDFFGTVLVPVNRVIFYLEVESGW